MNSLAILVLVSIIIQFLVERVKDFFPNSTYEKITKYVKPSVFSLVFSVIIAFGCRLNLFEMLNFLILPDWLGYLLTAIALSGGSVAINELIKSLASVKDYNNSVSSTINTSTINSDLLTEENKENISEYSKDEDEDSNIGKDS